MRKLELGTYVNCKDLPIEKVEKLLGRFVELAGETPCDVDDISEYSKGCEYYLVYCKNFGNNTTIWFWDDNRHCDKEMFYEDFFPEEQVEVLPDTLNSPTKMVTKDIYNIEFYCDDLHKNVTIRQYLKALLKTLWEEGEGFYGKRPFDNSGWERTLRVPLIENKVIDGEIYYWKDDFDNHYEDVEDYDKQEYYKVVKKLIEEL